MIRKAGVAELVDALDSGSSGRQPVGVRVPASAPYNLYLQNVPYTKYNKGLRCVVDITRPFCYLYSSSIIISPISFTGRS